MSILLPVAWLLAAILVGLAGRDRALGFWGFFVLSLLLSPIPVVLVLLLTAPRA
jgi:hypothetical protein